MASLISSQACIGKQVLGMTVFFFSAFVRPGDPAVLEGVPATTSPADLLNVVDVKLPTFWPVNIETWLVQSKSQFRLKVSPQSRLNLTMWSRACLKVML